MGNSPSVVSSLPSTDIQKDVSHLKNLFQCINKKFDVETNSLDSDYTALVANDGNLTLMLLSISSAFNAATPPSVTTLVLEESDIKTILRKQNLSSSTPSASKKEFATAKIDLPGGSILVLVPQNMMGSKTGRQQVMALLTECTNKNGDDHHQAVNWTTKKPLSPPPPQQQQNEHVPGNDSQTVSDNATTSTSSFPSIDRSNLPTFPSLDVRLMQKGGQLEPDFPLNTREGVPFETDLFQGKVLFICRPPGDPEREDPFWNERIFKNKQRRVIMQVQGKFKQEIKGILYAGGEISEPMKLGLISKSLANVMLKLMKSFYPAIHTSFGNDEESAHIVVPAYQFFETLIATKPGETPPTLGEPFEEPGASIKARKNSKSTGTWNTTDTYSMSFHSMYFDLPTWSLVNISMSNNMSLRTFWGKSCLKIVLYDRSAPESEERHLPEFNKYGFVVQTNYLGSSGTKSSKKTVDRVPNSDDENGKENEEDVTSSEAGILDWTEVPDRKDKEEQEIPRARNQIQVFGVDDEDTDQESVFDMNQFFDAEEYAEEKHSNSITSHAPELLQSVDNLCPAWIEMLANRGKYTRVYALNLPDSTQTIFRKADSVLQTFGSKGPEDNICSERMSNAEQNRRHLGQLLSSCLQDGASSIVITKIQSRSTDYDVVFLERARPPISEKRKIDESCFVARSLSDHHWIEEWATVSEQNVTFYHPDRRKANHCIGVQNILKVNRPDANKAPCFPFHYFLSIETLGRTTYLMFPTREQRDSWFHRIFKLQQLVPIVIDSVETSSEANASTALLDLENPKDEFLHKSSLWDYKHRRVLNCRQFCFRARDRASQHDPLALAEDALRKALDPRNESDDDILVSFLNSASQLKEAIVHDLSEVERLTFFLNVYHVMVMHAYLVLGTPKSSFQWISYFNSISYQCSDDIFSLAELEHCIIRSAMSSPAQFLSRFVLPKSTYDFAMTKRDCRINFALNCGSLSNPKYVPVYKANTLKKQLNEASRLYLMATKIKKRSNGDMEIFLPRMCRWYANDFGAGSEDIIQKVKPFLSDSIQELISLCEPDENEKYNLSIKFSPYSFECRKLALLPEPLE